MNILIPLSISKLLAMQSTGLVLLTLTLLVAAVGFITSQSTEYSFWWRILAWRNVRFDDFATKFPSRQVLNGPVTVHFRSTTPSLPAHLSVIPSTSGGQEGITPLESFLASTGTRAFLVLKDNQMLYEGYFNGTEHNSTQTSFSIAKSFVSALIGIAIDEGQINSVEDAISRYLPELAARPSLDRIRIQDLLTMSSGIRFKGSGAGANPFGDDARAYYDPNLRALALNVQAESPAGSRWQYNNFHPLLLGLILERATGRQVSTYLSEKLWQPLGMEAPGSWSLDSRHDSFEKMESGLNGRAIDFAKFGLLYLHGGQWNGQQIVPATWVAASTRHDLSSKPVQRGMDGLDYGYLWWLDAQVPGRFLAWGNLGQFIYVAPDRQAVLVRFGTRYGLSGRRPWVTWLTIFRYLVSQLP